MDVETVDTEDWLYSIFLYFESKYQRDKEWVWGFLYERQ